MNTCAQCGQPQVQGDVTAPMVHVATRGIASRASDLVSYHLDCMPHELEAAHVERHGPRIEAAKAGVRGDLLRDIPDNPEPEPVDPEEG